MPHATTTGVAVDALDEVNAARAARGLPPFIRDAALTEGALKIVEYRAVHGIRGHVMNGVYALDHQWAPSAATAGCDDHPLPMSYGWRTCVTYENYRYAGAAYFMGPDGKRWMHLFVR